MNLKIIDKFPYKNDVGYFNSSIVIFNDEKLIFSRKGVWNKNFKLFESSIVCLKENGSLIDINLPRKVNEQLEDPRAFIYKNDLYLSCASVDITDLSIIKQKVYKLNYDLSFNKILNYKCPFDERNVEKNWTYFQCGDDLYCVYELYPYTLFNINKTKIIENKFLVEYWNVEKYGIPRGSTNPILNNNIYYSFFHSFVHNNKKQRVYYVGMYKFINKPPFDIIQISGPHFCGSDVVYLGTIEEKEHYFCHSDGAIYPCGFIFEDGKILLSAGINDWKTALIYMDNEYSK